MAEAGEGEPKRCPCGFWGSPQTNNLCSKCYKECQQQRQEVASKAGEKNPTQLLTQYGLLSSGLGNSTSAVEIREPQQSQEQQNEGGEEGPSETEVDQMNKDKDESGNFLPGDLPSQKNRKRCWTCKSKLELAQRALGECKCGYVFCFLHRLPEQHHCVYDHKEGGRQEAMKSMVPASRKKFGRSFHRMDSRPEQ
jgi:hypothetical protein